MDFLAIIENLAKQAGLAVEAVNQSYVKCVFNLPHGRGQVVHLFPVGELGQLQIVRISTPVLELPDNRLPAKIAEGLLRENSLMKIGAFCLEEIDGHKILALQHNMVLETLDPQELLIVVGAIAVTGDQWEKQLTSADKY